MSWIDCYGAAKATGSMFPIAWVGCLVSVCAACASVVPPANGDAGTGGTDETAICGKAEPEDNDAVDEERGVATGTVNGTCTIFEGEVLGCEGSDLLDEVYVTALQDGALGMDLSWDNASSDLDRAVFGLPPGCEPLAVSTNRAGSSESLTFDLASGNQVVVAILGVDTNGSSEAYTLE